MLRNKLELLSFLEEGKQEIQRVSRHFPKGENERFIGFSRHFSKRRIRGIQTFPIHSRSGINGEYLEIQVNFLAFLWAFLDKKRRPCNAAKPSIFLGFSRFSLRGVDA